MRERRAPRVDDDRVVEICMRSPRSVVVIAPGKNKTYRLPWRPSPYKDAVGRGANN